MNKLEEYIPGDLVMTNGVPLGTEKDVIYRVTSSDPSKILKLNDETVLKGVVCLENMEGAEIGDKGYLSGDSCAWVKDIVPITLTSGILEKNGWIRKKDIPFAYTKGVYTIIECVNKPGVFCVCFGISEYHTLRYVMYVHQLQHLYFSLGSDSNMIV